MTVAVMIMTMTVMLTTVKFDGVLRSATYWTAA